MRQYHIFINSEPKGPYSYDELKMLKISKDTLIWHEGLTDWIKAEEIEELASYFKTVPPPMLSKTIKDISVINVNLIKSKNKDSEILKRKRSIIISKEIITAFKIVCIGILLGLISFPVFYFIKYSHDKVDGKLIRQRLINEKTEYDAISKKLASLYQIAINNPESEYSKYIIEEKRNDSISQISKKSSLFSSFFNSLSDNGEGERRRYRERRILGLNDDEIYILINFDPKQNEDQIHQIPRWESEALERILDDSLIFSLALMLICSSLLIIGRYAILFISWIIKNARKEI